MSHVLHAGTMVCSRVEGIREKKSIIGTARVEVDCFRAVINDSTQRVAREKLEIVREALVQLHSHPVIRRVCFACQEEDAVKAREDRPPCRAELLSGYRVCAGGADVA